MKDDNDDSNDNNDEHKYEDQNQDEHDHDDDGDDDDDDWLNMIGYDSLWLFMIISYYDAMIVMWWCDDVMMWWCDDVMMWWQMQCSNTSQESVASYPSSSTLQVWQSSSPQHCPVSRGYAQMMQQKLGPAWVISSFPIGNIKIISTKSTYLQQIQT